MQLDYCGEKKALKQNLNFKIMQGHKLFPFNSTIQPWCCSLLWTVYVVFDIANSNMYQWFCSYPWENGQQQ